MTVAKSRNAIPVKGSVARLGEIQAALKDTGYALVCGTCPTVGVAGRILGGGYGFLACAYVWLDPRVFI